VRLVCKPANKNQNQLFLGLQEKSIDTPIFSHEKATLATKTQVLINLDICLLRRGKKKKR